LFLILTSRKDFTHAKQKIAVFERGIGGKLPFQNQRKEEKETIDWIYEMVVQRRDDETI